MPQCSRWERNANTDGRAVHVGGARLAISWLRLRTQVSIRTGEHAHGSALVPRRQAGRFNGNVYSLKRKCLSLNGSVYRAPEIHEALMAQHESCVMEGWPLHYSSVMMSSRAGPRVQHSIARRGTAPADAGRALQAVSPPGRADGGGTRSSAHHRGPR